MRWVPGRFFYLLRKRSKTIDYHGYDRVPFFKNTIRYKEFALATKGFLSLEENNMLQMNTIASTGFLSFKIPYLERGKGFLYKSPFAVGTRCHLFESKGKTDIMCLWKILQGSRTLGIWSVSATAHQD